MKSDTTDPAPTPAPGKRAWYGPCSDPAESDADVPEVIIHVGKVNLVRPPRHEYMTEYFDVSCPTIAAIREDNVHKLIENTRALHVWKNVYTRALIRFRAFACIRAFVRTKHPSVRNLDLYAAMYTKSPKLLRVCSNLNETCKRDPNKLIDIIDDRSDLNSYQKKVLSCSIVGM